MMMQRKPAFWVRMTCLALCLMCAALLMPAKGAYAMAIRDCHKVKLTKSDTTQANGSVIRVWTPETALEYVDNELSRVRQKYLDKYGPTLQKANNKTSQNSRLDLETRYSRTGLSWESFVVQARVTYHRKLIAQEFTTRTYDMETGERIYMDDLFDDDSEGWDILSAAVREQLTAYFPDEEPDAAVLDELCSRDGLEKAEFSLHGMSLVLHYCAGALYPGKTTLMNVTLFYPEICPYMSYMAQLETQNEAYYKFCALTFDDGPTRTNTTLVLNSLMETGATATFFVIGNLVEECADLVQKEHDNGHAVAAHNWTHGDVRKMSDGAMRMMKDKVNKQMIATIGIPVRYDRVPYGLYPQMIKAKVGWPLIQWSVDTYDWRGKSTNAVLNTVKKELHDGAIILCHDIKDNTPASAKAIAEYAAEQGYMLLTIDELFARDGVELKPDTVYFRCENGETSIKNP